MEELLVPINCVVSRRSSHTDDGLPVVSSHTACFGLNTASQDKNNVVKTQLKILKLAHKRLKTLIECLHVFRRVCSNLSVGPSLG